jgi:glycosyltransferase involved in cell wall biosynthesis
MKPLVSVIIPTYNYAHFIKKAIGSVLQQTYPIELIEIIVVDDGSTDNTEEILKDWIERGTVRFYYQQNSGKANATKNAIKYCTGKYIFNLDADDYFLPQKIERYVELFEKDESIVHIGSAARLVFEETGKTLNENPPAVILEKMMDGKELLKKIL